MPEKRKRIFVGLAAATAGAVGVYYGARALDRYIQRRAHDKQRWDRLHQRIRYTPETSRASQATRVEGTRYQPHTQPDRQSIPATGTPAMVMAETAPSFIASQPVTASEMAGPLAQYLLTFQELIRRLRMRRLETGAGSGTGSRSLSPADRDHFRDALERLADQFPALSDGDLPDNTLEQRIYNLAVKIRGALQDYTLSDDDLFRINGEVRSEACQVLDNIPLAGAELMEARKAYECG